MSSILTVSVEEAARLGGVCVDTVRRWANAGHLLPAAFGVTGRNGKPGRRFRVGDVRRASRLPYSPAS